METEKRTDQMMGEQKENAADLMRKEAPLCGKKAAFLSLGCKVNAYETEAMRELFEAAGAQTVDFEEMADIYVVNTCTVTNIADRKSRQMLHRAKKKNPESIVVAAGCYVQAAQEDLKKDPAVDILVGNNRKNEAVHLVEQYIRERCGNGSELTFEETKKEWQGGKLVQENAEKKMTEPELPEEVIKKSMGESEPVRSNAKQSITEPVPEPEKTGGENKLSSMTEISREREYEELTVSLAEKTRAYIKVQDGCNQFCTYCIIPFARGRIRSRGMDEVEAEVRRLAEKGYQEIVLTGIHLSSYGMEAYPEKERFALCLPDEDMPLVKLICRLNMVSGIRRIRLGSLEPRIVTERFAAAIAGTKVCPHFHLSLQSGCDATLQRMNRRYTTEEYLKSCGILRHYFDRPAITTDVIAGFPGETEAEFIETMNFVQKVQFAQMHIFKYSRRKGTKAAQMPDQIPEEVKGMRSEALIALEKKMRRAYEQSFAGQETEVLFEERVVFDGKLYMVGHNERYIKFAMQTDEDLSDICIKGHINGDFAGEFPLIERKQSK